MPCVFNMKATQPHNRSFELPPPVSTMGYMRSLTISTQGPAQRLQQSIALGTDRCLCSGRAMRSFSEIHVPVGTAMAPRVCNADVDRSSNSKGCSSGCEATLTCEGVGLRDVSRFSGRRNCSHGFCASFKINTRRAQTNDQIQNQYNAFANH